MRLHIDLVVDCVGLYIQMRSWFGSAGLLLMSAIYPDKTGFDLFTNKRSLFASLRNCLNKSSLHILRPFKIKSARYNEIIYPPKDMLCANLRIFCILDPLQELSHCINTFYTYAVYGSQRVLSFVWVSLCVSVCVCPMDLISFNCNQVNSAPLSSPSTTSTLRLAMCCDVRVGTQSAYTSDIALYYSIG